MKLPAMDLLWQTKVAGTKGPCLLRASVFQCTRCNACVQYCPAYLRHPQEMFSPRGRVQMLRQLAENKIKWSDCQPFLSKMINSCALCGQCTAACAGQVPVGSYMYILSQAAHQKNAPLSLQMLLRLSYVRPPFFDQLVRVLLCLHRIKVLFILRPFLPKWLRHADHILPSKNKSLDNLLKENHFTCEPDKPKLIYLPSLYAAYADGEAGWRTVQIAAARTPFILRGFSSGLAEYLYISPSRARQAAKRLLVKWEKISGKHALPLLTDSIEVYSFLKNYPVLFADFAGWQSRAQKMADHVIYITGLPVTKKQAILHQTGLDTSGVLFPTKEIVLRAQKILLTDHSHNLLHCQYSRSPLPAAGLGFKGKIRTEEMVRQHIQDITQKQIVQVYCLSGWAALELQSVLKHLYPSLKAQHFIYGIKGYGRKQKGNNTAIGR